MFAIHKNPNEPGFLKFLRLRENHPLYTSVIFEGAGNQLNDYFEILKLIILN